MFFVQNHRIMAETNRMLLLFTAYIQFYEVSFFAPLHFIFGESVH
jgi:hypothetical protein